MDINKLKRRIRQCSIVTGECWVWTLRLNERGYGCISWMGKQWKVHRLSYLAFKGELIDGMEIDHLCRNRACVNPDHLEQVTKTVNILRGVSPQAENAKKSNCPKGHPYDETNTKFYKGQRYCRECRRIYRRAKKARDRLMRKLMKVQLEPV